MFDDIIAATLGLLTGSGLTFLFINRVTKLEDVEGEEPAYIIGRGDRSPHIHHYDTMDIATNGKFVCGTCRKAKSP